jgi:hypothetical protein
MPSFCPWLKSSEIRDGIKLANVCKADPRSNALIDGSNCKITPSSQRDPGPRMRMKYFV